MDASTDIILKATPKLGQILIQMNLLNLEDLKNALVTQEKMSFGATKFKLGEILIFHRKINSSQLQEALSLQKISAAKEHSEKNPLLILIEKLKTLLRLK